MNLEVRRLRQTENLPAEDARTLQELLDRTRSTAKTNVEPGQWYALRIRIRGDIMKAFLDDEPVTNLKSPGIDHSTKTKLGFTVNGASIDFDNLRIRTIANQP